MAPRRGSRGKGPTSRGGASASSGRGGKRRSGASDKNAADSGDDHESESSVVMTPPKNGKPGAESGAGKPEQKLKTPKNKEQAAISAPAQKKKTPGKKPPPPGTATPRSSSPLAPGSSADEGEDVRPGSSSKRQKKAGAAPRDRQDEAMFDPQDEENEGAGEADGPAKREKKKVPTKRKGMARSKASPALPLAPGDPANPSSFITIDGNEQQLAAYLGYNDVRQLRILAMTWPVLDAVTSFDPIAANMNKKSAFRLINDNEAQYKGVEKPEEKWPLDEGDEDAMKQQKKSRHLACILLAFKNDLTTLKSPDQDFHMNFQRNFLARYNSMTEGHEVEVPDLDFSGTQTSLEPGRFSVSPPELGPYIGESRLEPINRCWLLLKYFRNCRAISGQWTQKFSAAALSQSISVDLSHVPHWMRPREAETEELSALKKPAAVMAADALAPLDINISWDKEAEFEEKDELDDVLKSAKSKSILIPSTDVKLQQDPRLCPSVEYFRDSIRRQFNCPKIGMDIRSLELHYKNLALSKSTKERDIFRSPWEETKSTFEDGKNSDFTIHVQFKAAEDPDNILETFEAPPAVAALFDVSSGDVLRNEEGIQETFIAAFGDDLAEQATEPVKNDDTEPRLDFLDLVFSYGSSALDIGSPPKPRKFRGDGAHAKFLAWYDGVDVNDPEARREWQRSVLNEATQNGQVATLKIEKLPKDLSADAKEAIERAQLMGMQLAAAKEGDELGGPSAPLEKYFLTNTHYSQRIYSQQMNGKMTKITTRPKTAFTGTNARAGPQVDLCMALLDCEPDPKDPNRLIPRLLRDKVKITDRSFYNYQISGAVGVVLKLYGDIDPDALLRACGQPDHPRASEIRQAAAGLNDLLVHGCILADDVGFGKTITGLLVAFFHTFLYDEVDENGEELFKPIYLVVPASVVTQWLVEIRNHWPYFTAVASYEDHGLKTEMALHSLSDTAMKEYPSLEAVPSNLRYIWDTKDKKAMTTIIVTSYETNKKRVGIKMTRKVPGVHYRPPRRGPNGRFIWKRKPRKQHFWITNHKKACSLLIGDEAQKIKNYHTGWWSVIWVQGFRKTFLITATPIFNSVNDLLALLTLLWAMAKYELMDACDNDPSISQWLADIAASTDKDLMQELRELPRTDSRRLKALDPQLLRRAISSKTNLHLKVANHFDLVQDIVMIQRCLASSLPQQNGEPIPLRGLFKKLVRKTAIVPRSADEELEYQLFHRDAASDYVNEISSMPNIAPKKPRRFEQGGSFIAATRSLRDLAIANFSTKLARLNRAMLAANGNTHVKTMQQWRDQGLEAEFIQDITRGPGEPKSRTAREMVLYLCDGSPACRLVFQEILAAKAIEKLDKKKYKQHQKVMPVEATVPCAWYLEQTLRAALLDARVMHAGLSNQAKAELCDLFNDPNSTLKILIIMYDVGAVGLNLHLACNRVLGLAIPRSEGQNGQAAGRVNRVTSEFPAIFTVRHTPNSHDQFKAARQTDKATVHLAANSHDPAIRKVVVGLLNALQPEVNACHESDEGQELLRQIKDRARLNAIVLESRKKSVIQQRRVDDDLKEALKESAKLQPPAQVTGVEGGARARKAPERYDNLAYSAGGEPLAKEIVEARRNALQQQTCEFCLGMIKKEKDMLMCHECCYLGHVKCFGLKTHPGEDFVCPDCRDVQQGKRKLKQSTSAEDGSDVSEYEDEDAVDAGDGETVSDIEEASQEVADGSSSSEWEGPGPNQANYRKHLAMESRMAEAEEFQFLKTLDLQAFCDENQPDDAERHKLALLQIPPGKHWTDKDLEEEFYLKLGLHLLYNKIQGKDEIHFGASIHIRYLAFPKDVVTRMEKNRQVDDRRGSVARKRGL